MAVSTWVGCSTAGWTWIMAASLYPTAYAGLLSGDIDWTALNVKAVLLTGSFVYDSGHIFRDEIHEDFVIAESDAVETPTYVDGVAGGQPAAFLQLLSNKEVQHVILYDDTGDPAYSRLLLYLDADAVDGVPFIPQGLDYFLYPVTPPGGFFSIEGEESTGEINSQPLGAPFALGESQEGFFSEIPQLVFGGRLVVRDRVCATPSEVQSCCKPTIRGSLCE